MHTADHAPHVSQRSKNTLANRTHAVGIVGGGVGVGVGGGVVVVAVVVIMLVVAAAVDACTPQSATRKPSVEEFHCSAHATTRRVALIRNT